MDLEHFTYEIKPLVIMAIGIAAVVSERGNSAVTFFGALIIGGGALILIARLKNRGYL